MKLIPSPAIGLAIGAIVTSILVATAPSSEAFAASATDVTKAMPSEHANTATFGETADAGYGIKVTPISVEKDSRCPNGATCIWAGTLVLRAKVEHEKQSVESSLELGKPTRIYGGMLTLNNAGLPARVDGTGATYRFSFSFAPDIASPAR